jgi:hypothetical protein
MWPSMRVQVTRDGVGAADDDLRDLTLNVPQADTLESLVTSVFGIHELPRIAGGLATWCLVSRWPLAVIAQQWPAPRIVPWPTPPISDCKIVDGTVQFHFTYLAQIDPEVVFEVLRRLRLEDD